MKKIKLIWDFTGKDHLEIAKHHEIHLSEFIKREKLMESIAGIEVVSETHTIAHIIVLENDMIPVRDALRPVRGEWVE